jgi:hypothetical protein
MRYVIIDQHAMIAGPASDALVVISTILNQLMGLIAGEEAPLKDAPDEVLALARESINTLKRLNAEVNALVGEKPAAKENDSEDKEPKKKGIPKPPKK